MMTSEVLKRQEKILNQKLDIELQISKILIKNIGK